MTHSEHYRCSVCGAARNVTIEEFARRVVSDPTFARYVFERLSTDQKAAFVECFGRPPPVRGRD